MGPIAPLEGREVEGLYPFLVDEAAQQVGDHLGMGKELLVGAVVFRHEVPWSQHPFYLNQAEEGNRRCRR